MGNYLDTIEQRTVSAKAIVEGVLKRIALASDELSVRCLTNAAIMMDKNLKDIWDQKIQLKAEGEKEQYFEDLKEGDGLEQA